MADPLFFAPLRVPLIDQRTGLMSREWYLFFEGLWRRTGGPSGQSNDDLLQSISQGLSTSDLSQQQQTDAAAAGQIPAQLDPLAVELLKSMAGAQQLPAGAPTSEFAKQLQDLGQIPAARDWAIPFNHLRSGVWTPTDNSGAGLAITNNQSTWVRHENLVFARTCLIYPATVSAAVAQITGLPFLVDPGNATRQGFISYANVATPRFTLPVSSTLDAFFYDGVGATIPNSALSTALLFVSWIYTTPSP